MNSCRVLRNESGVVFGESVFHVVRRRPKTTPDLVHVVDHPAYRRLEPVVFGAGDDLFLQFE
jgi:hypothetical protein